MMNGFLRAACLVLATWIAGDLSAQCPTCTPNLPTMPADTIYLDSFPNARKGVYYQETVSFRFPYTTTPLAAVQPGTPSGIALESFEITGISGLPLGLTYTPDRNPMLYNEDSPDTRDGCLTVCGIPQQSGTFTINVSLMVATGVIAPTPANIPITFVVEPDTSATFTMDTSRGCAPLTVTFTNMVQTLGNETWVYNWDFGNGSTSTDSMPMPVTYQDSGTYTVSMTAISTLTIPRTFLTAVTVTGASCTDPFGNAVDMFVTVGQVGAGIDTVTAFVSNTNPPVIYTFGQDVLLQANTDYYVWVQDDDAISNGFPGPADCGTIYFSSDTTPTRFTLTSGGLTMAVQLSRDTLYDRDTLTTSDLVVVLDCDTTSVTRYELDELLSLNLFPNPASEQVNINLELKNSSSEVQVRLFDALGRTVKTEIWNDLSSNYNKTIQLGQIPQGIYTVQIQANGRIYTRKLVVQ